MLDSKKFNFNINTLLGFTLVLLSGVGFGFLGIFGRLAFESGLSVGELLTYRFFLAGIILAIYLLAFKPHLIKLELKQIVLCAGLGILGYAVFSTLYFKSIEGISVPLAAILLFTFPIFVNLGAHYILKERMTPYQLISLILACIGLGILLWGPLIINSFWAVFYALAAAFTYSIYVLVSGRYQKNITPITSSLYIIIFSAIALFLFHHPSIDKISSLSTKQIYLIFGIAIVSTIGPMTLFLAGLQKLGSSKSSIIVMIEPVVAAVAAWAILNENLSFNQFIGAFLVLLALVINTIK